MVGYNICVGGGGGIRFGFCGQWTVYDGRYEHLLLVSMHFISFELISYD